MHDDELAYLSLPLDGVHRENANYATAVLRAKFAGKQHTWESKIVRTEGELDPQTRMINIIAQVDAPYESVAGRPPLAVGLFVEAEILGMKVDDVYVLPRSAIQANNQVYVISDDNTLQFRDVDILRTVDEAVYVTGGISAGDTVCLSTIDNAIRHMSVRPVASTATTQNNQQPQAAL